MTVINTDGQGVASRPGPHLSPTNGYGAPAGASVSTICWAWGDAVGPYNNRLWWDISYAGRQFYASDHYLSTPDSGQPPAGQPQCNTGPAPVTPDDNAWYTLTARASNKDLDVRWGTAANGTAVQQYWANGTKAQQWRFVHTDSGYYRLVSALTGSRVLDVSGWGTANGTKVQTWDWAGGANQQWEPFDAGSGYVTLKPRHVGRCLDVPGASQNAWVQLQIYDCNGTAAQQFHLTVVGTVSSSPGRLNSAIAQIANSYATGSHGGQCLAWVSSVIGAAGAPHTFGNDASTYQQQWSQIASPVASISAARPGDIVQWYAPPSAPLGEMEHTTIIVSTSNGVVTVRDSNWDDAGTILQGTFDNRNNWMTGHYAAMMQIWRMN